MKRNLGEYAEYEWSNQRLLLKTRDVAEGFRSFIEKRSPNFSGE